MAVQANLRHYNSFPHIKHTAYIIVFTLLYVQIFDLKQSEQYSSVKIVMVQRLVVLPNKLSRTNLSHFTSKAAIAFCFN